MTFTNDSYFGSKQDLLIKALSINLTILNNIFSLNIV